jgi:hypothetical protein
MMPTEFRPAGAIRPFGGQSTHDPKLEEFLEHSWRLPEIARSYTYHRSYEAGGYWDNPSVRRTLPVAVTPPIKGLIHHYRRTGSGFGAAAKAALNTVVNVFDDACARQFLESAGASKQGGFADWFSLMLWEPRSLPTIHYRVQRTRHDLWVPSIEDARDTRFYADVPIQLVLYVGRNPIMPVFPPDQCQPAQIKGRVYYSQAFSMERNRSRWFKIGCYVPETEAKAVMDGEARNHYRQIEEWYHKLHWYERGKELAAAAAPGAIKLARGFLTGFAGGDVDLPRGSPAMPRLADRGPQGARGEAEPGTLDHLQRLWYGDTHSFNRKNLPPPGYVFVKFNCILETIIVGVGW